MNMRAGERRTPRPVSRGKEWETIGAGMGLPRRGKLRRRVVGHSMSE